MLHFIEKGFPSISFISKDYQTKVVLYKIPEPLWSSTEAGVISKAVMQPSKVTRA